MTNSIYIDPETGLFDSNQPRKMTIKYPGIICNCCYSCAHDGYCKHHNLNQIISPCLYYFPAGPNLFDEIERMVSLIADEMAREIDKEIVDGVKSNQ